MYIKKENCETSHIVNFTSLISISCYLCVKNRFGIYIST